MLIGNRKSKSSEQNWCVVLNSLQSEMDKTRVARKISEVFALSAEEARDLVSSTPIILLDNLTRPIAAKVKDYFRLAGAEISLTNDILLKRKYYRTVWPEPPSLAFLHNWEPSRKGNEEQEVLAPDEALSEIRSASERNGGSLPGQTPVQKGAAEEPAEAGEDPDEVYEELEQSRQECSRLRREMEKLRQEVASKQWDQLEGGSSSDDETGESHEREIHELRELLANAQEKYDVLKEEYREAQQLFEDKMAGTGITHRAAGAQPSAAGVASEIEKSETAKDQEISRMKAALRQAETAVQEQVLSLTRELSQWKAKVDDTAVKVRNLEEANATLERIVGEQTREVYQWRERNQALTHELVQLRRSYEEAQSHRSMAEERQHDLEKNQLGLIQELEQRAKESRDWQLRCLELDKKVVQLNLARDRYEQSVSEHEAKIRERDCAVLDARKELERFQQQAAARERQLQRQQLEKQLNEKEQKLKGLVREQQKIESEIRDREQSMRKILLQQEAMEKEILEDQQAFRFLSDKNQREKPQESGKMKIDGPSAGAQKAPGDLSDDRAGS